MKRILFTGGGSAGHVVPNLAVMHELRYTYALSYMGTDGIEKRLIAEAGFPFLEVNCPKLVRAVTAENLKIPFLLARAKRAARAILKDAPPDLVVSKGGYASYPAVWAASRLGIPVITHESDLSPGLCTRLIAKKCRYVLTSFPETAQKFANGRWTGSPVRREVLSGERDRARRKFQLPKEGNVLLVFGGGSGSRALNEAIAAHLGKLLKTFSILHLAGREASETRLEKGGVYVRKPFETDMGSAYAAADAVLARAGSNTVFELLALKKPALLVPLGKNSRGDQTENARYFETRGLCRVLPEARLAELVPALQALLQDRALRENLAAADYPDGTGRVISAIEDVLGGASE